MTIYTQVDPESFIKPAQQLPVHGRGAWTKTGIDFDYRYALADELSMRIGTRAQLSLDHWSVSAGSNAIQTRLTELGLMTPTGPGEKGIFGPRTETAVKLFQQASTDPDGDAPLVVDGTVGRSDARALFAPLVQAVERKFQIPNDYLLGEVNHESRLDPGAIGYYVYYPDYRGVDRSVAQINSRSNAQVTWSQAYDVRFALEWSGRRLRDFHDRFAADYPDQRGAWWDAAICAHNNPSAANQWARTGKPPTEAAALYVASVKAARF